MDFETLVARGGRDVVSASRPLTPPIYQTNVYVFEDMDTVESVWESKKPGFVYGRYGTANHTMLEDLVAALEGAEAAVACASGMGATTVRPARAQNRMTWSSGASPLSRTSASTNDSAYSLPPKAMPAS